MDNNAYIISLIRELCKLPNECEWVEFKHNNAEKDSIGGYISALANSAALCGKSVAYVVWGVEDQTHDIVGTTFNPLTTKVGNEELENWLLQRLNPKLHFRFHRVDIDDRNVVLLEIPATSKHPTAFQHEELIRVGSYRRKLKDFPEKERELWRTLDKTPFEILPAIERLPGDKVLQLFDYQSMCDLLKIPVPDGNKAILARLLNEELIVKDEAGLYSITNVGAILFAKNLEAFKTLARKAVRVIQYKGEDKSVTLREQVGTKGYAVGFEGLIEFIMTLLPAQENLDTDIRDSKTFYPRIAVRELVANALIHQDFSEMGSGVLIELYETRLEISNPGSPLVETMRFLDTQPKSRNEKLAFFMRRMGICEERGSGIDKVIIEVELSQLPAPIFENGRDFTRAILFSHRELRNLTRLDRTRACYFHACLKYIQRDYMTNASLRERFGISQKNSAIASRIIKDALSDEAICPYDDTASRKYMQYIPHWAK